jgi:hypothetical protein
MKGGGEGRCGRRYAAPSSYYASYPGLAPRAETAAAAARLCLTIICDLWMTQHISRTHPNAATVLIASLGQFLKQNYE